MSQPDAPKNPRAVAETIVAALPSTEYLADKPTLAGPGFINVKISSQWMGARIQNMLRNGIKTWAPRLNRNRVVIDFSSPNVAKEMHVGHLRSTIIGDTLSTTLEFCGADVLRLNHVVSVLFCADQLTCCWHQHGLSNDLASLDTFNAVGCPHMHEAEQYCCATPAAASSSCTEFTVEVLLAVSPSLAVVQWVVANSHLSR